MNATYAQITAAARRSGGQTMTEAVESLTDARLRRRSVGGLFSLEDALRAEAKACTTEAQYDRVRTQVARVTAVRRTKDGMGA